MYCLEIIEDRTGSFAFFALFESFCRQNCFICIVWKLLRTELLLLDTLHCLRDFADKTAHLFCLELIEDRTAPFGFFALFERFCRQNCFICIVWKLLKTELVLLHSLEIIEDKTGSFAFFALFESFCRQNCFICIVWKSLKTELLLLDTLHCLRDFADKTASFVLFGTY